MFDNMDSLRIQYIIYIFLATSNKTWLLKVEFDRPGERSPE